MRNSYLRKKESLNNVKDDNEISGSSNNVEKRIFNKYPKNRNNKNNHKDYLSSDYYVNSKNQTKESNSCNSNELSKILGKINKEFYKNKKNYTNISDCFQKDYLNLKNMNTSKTVGSSSQNLSRNHSQCSFNNNLKESCIYEKKKHLSIITPNYFSNNNIFYPNQVNMGNNSILTDNMIRHIYQIQPIDKQHYIKKTISNFILKRPNNNIYANTEMEIENDNNNFNDDDNKIIQVRKKHKSLKKNKSQNKFKTNIVPLYKNDQGKNNKSKNVLSNPKVIHNLGNFYNFWSDNDGHLGGKINLALNNIYRNKINFHYYLYYIIKIQSNWRGYILRKNLLKKSDKISLIKMIYKQKKLLKLLFFILYDKYKRDCFKIFIEKINDIKNGYDINSSLLYNISNCYQNYKNGQKLFLYNKKRLKEKKNNIKLYNKEMILDINSSKIKKTNTTIRSNHVNNKDNNKVNKDNKNKVNYSNYKINKTTQICFRHYKKKANKNPEKEDIKEKEKRKVLNDNKKPNKFLYILPSEQKFFSIKNNNKNNNNDNKNNDKNINDKNNEVPNIIKRKKTSLKNTSKPDNNIININNNNKINKYKEYIYFFFLLFARIQKASHRYIYKTLINRLNEIKNYNLKKIRKNKLLKIIKINERKKMVYYFRVFKEKVLQERIKDIIFSRNNNNHNRIQNINHLNIIKKNKSKHNNLSCSDIKLHNNNNLSLNRISRQQNGKKYIRIKKIKRSTSVSYPIRKNISTFFNNHTFLGQSISPSITHKKIIKRGSSNITNLTKYGEFYRFSPEYILCKKVKNIFDKLDKKEIKFYFKRWKIKKNARKKKKFLIYFIMLMKEYFCNDKSLKHSKEFILGKFMFFWYRKTFY